MVGGARWGIELVECLDGETGLAQDGDPVPVAGVKLHASAGGVQAGHLTLGVQQFGPRWAGALWQAHGGQDAGGVEHQPAAGPQQPGGLGDPPGRVTPQARPALGDHQVKAGAAKRDIGGVCLDEREDDPALALALPRGAQLNRGDIHADRPGTAAGQPGGEIRGAAAQLDDVQARNIAQDAELALGDVEDSPGDLLSGPGPGGMSLGVLGVRLGPHVAVEARLPARRLPIISHAASPPPSPDRLPAQPADPLIRRAAIGEPA